MLASRLDSILNTIVVILPDVESLITSCSRSYSEVLN